MEDNRVADPAVTGLTITARAPAESASAPPSAQMAFAAANLRRAPMAASRKYRAVLIVITYMYAIVQIVPGNTTSISST